MSIPNFVKTEWKSKGAAVVQISDSNCNECQKKWYIDNEKEEKENMINTSCSHSKYIKCYMSILNVWEYECKICIFEINTPSGIRSVTVRKPTAISSFLWSSWEKYWKYCSNFFVNLAWTHRFPNLVGENNRMWLNRVFECCPYLKNHIQYYNDIPLILEQQLSIVDSSKTNEYKKVLNDIWYELSIKRMYIQLRLFLYIIQCPISKELKIFFESEGITEDPLSLKEYWKVLDSSPDENGICRKKISIAGHIFEFASGENNSFVFSIDEEFSNLLNGFSFENPDIENYNNNENMAQFGNDEMEMSTLGTYQDKIEMSHTQDNLEMEITSDPEINVGKRETSSYVTNLDMRAASDHDKNLETKHTLDLETNLDKKYPSDPETNIDIKHMSNSETKHPSDHGTNLDTKNMSDTETKHPSDPETSLETKNLPDLETDMDIEDLSDTEIFFDVNEKPELETDSDMKAASDLETDLNIKDPSNSETKSSFFEKIPYSETDLDIKQMSHHETNLDKKEMSEHDTNIELKEVSDSDSNLNLKETLNLEGNLDEKHNDQDCDMNEKENVNPNAALNNVEANDDTLSDNVDKIEHTLIIKKKRGGKKSYSNSKGVAWALKHIQQKLENSTQSEVIRDSDSSICNGSALVNGNCQLKLSGDASNCLNTREETTDKKDFDKYENAERNSEDVNPGIVETNCDDVNPEVDIIHSNYEENEEEHHGYTHEKNKEKYYNYAYEEEYYNNTHENNKEYHSNTYDESEKYYEHAHEENEEHGYNHTSTESCWEENSVEEKISVNQIAKNKNPVDSANGKNQPWYMIFSPFWWFGYSLDKEITTENNMKEDEKKSLSNFLNIFKSAVKKTCIPNFSCECLHVTKVKKLEDIRNPYENLVRVNVIAKDESENMSTTDVSIRFMTEEEIDYEIEYSLNYNVEDIYGGESLDSNNENDQNFDNNLSSIAKTGNFEEELNFALKLEDSEDWVCNSKITFDENGDQKLVPLSFNEDYPLHRKIGQILKNHQLIRFSSEDQHYLNTPPDLPKELTKYWLQRHRLFLKYDQDIKLDNESWFSVTPEFIAIHQAYRCACDTVVDAFCGAGGNAIQLAYTCNHVIAIDIDPKKIEIARHNARVYGVEDRIEFIEGDFFKLAPFLKADVVLLSPPWGGIDYNKNNNYDVLTLGGSMNCKFLIDVTKKISPNIALYVPKSSNLLQLIELAGINGKVDIEFNYISCKRKAITAYYGNLAEYSEEKLY